MDALFNKSRRKANPKNRVDEKTERAAVMHAMEYPAHGQVRASNELRKQVVLVSPTGVRGIWLRNNLGNFFKDRLRALEEKVAREGIILTEAQVAALEKKTHDYQLYLALNDIDHTTTKAKSPQTNGICERFHKTILQEFYQVTFRKKLYTEPESLQVDLDEWLVYCNEQRTHQGKMCCG
jgi:hypothetical protein